MMNLYYCIRRVQAQSDTLEACEDFKMDYFECIHHKKEVSIGIFLMHALGQCAPRRYGLL
jgi:hypothetical protein